MTERLRIAAFGFRSFPPQAGSAGADKFASELLPRLAARGHSVVAYNRVYPDTEPSNALVEDCSGVIVRPLRTIHRKGFDTFLHSAKATYDIVRNDRADIVHIQNGGNSVFGAVLRLFGKKTFLSQDGLDWQREKWPWYARLFLFVSSYLTAYVHTAVIFDNIYAREHFSVRFKKTYDFIPFGADVGYVGTNDEANRQVLSRLKLQPGGYFLFVGRFIPDKGLHWLIPAFEDLVTEKKLVLVGGSPNPSAYEDKIKCTQDRRIIFPGFMYGSDVHELMCHSFAYVQPSVIEGLSPVILEAAYLGAPIICTDIPENRYAMDEHALYFRSGDPSDLTRKLHAAVSDPALLRERASAGSESVAHRFSWDAVVDQHEEVFRR